MKTEPPRIVEPLFSAMPDLLKYILFYPRPTIFLGSKRPLQTHGTQGLPLLGQAALATTALGGPEGKRREEQTGTVELGWQRRGHANAGTGRAGSPDARPLQTTRSQKLPGGLEEEVTGSLREKTDFINLGKGRGARACWRQPPGYSWTNTMSTYIHKKNAPTKLKCCWGPLGRERPWRAPDGPRGPQDAPRRPREASGGLEEPPKTAQMAPTWPKMGPRRQIDGPRGPQEAPRELREASREGPERQTS